MSGSPILVWFRQDLRLADNPALAAAAASGRPVIAVFILDRAADGRAWGAASLWWLGRSLAALARALAARGSRLILRRADSASQIERLVQETGAGAVYWNRLYGGAAIARDDALAARLKAAAVEARTFNASLLIEPSELRTGGGGAYRVFTPFWRAARAAIGAPVAPPAPANLTPPAAWPASERVEDWGLQPAAPDWSTGFSGWTPGEDGAQARLDDFLGRALKGYAEHRDEPARPATSGLSPHLHWGEIGPRQVWTAGHGAVAAGLAPEPQLDKLLAELGWREFNHHLLVARPDVARANLRPAFDAMPWRTDAPGLAAWRQGRTGYPLVDAGMRQLWATGWMHNRVRMITASFLIKHLLIDWRQGEAWFWDTLVDACAANNPGNWQWVAGSGADAAPFFRIFNPVVQGERFDPDGAYVRRWVPELDKVPASAVHKPWTMGGAKGYPPPIVEHAAARARALQAFKALP